mgnify:CR=1 FL=1
MSKLSDKLVKKLQKLAAVVDAEKQLYFFGLVQTESGPADRWDILVSAKKLAPWSTEAIKYIAELLRKRLTAAEMIQISQVVALPRDNELIASLRQDGRIGPGRIRGLHPMEHPTEAVVIWPAQNSLRPATVA